MTKNEVQLIKYEQRSIFRIQIILSMDTQAVLLQITTAIAPLLHRIVLLQADNISIKAQLAELIKPIKPIHNTAQNNKGLQSPRTHQRVQKAFKAEKVSPISELLPKDKQRNEKSMEKGKFDSTMNAYNTKLIKSVKLEETLMLKSQDSKMKKLDPIQEVVNLLQQMGDSWQVSRQAMIPQSEEAKLIDPMGVMIEMSLKNSTLCLDVINMWKQNVSKFADNQFLPVKAEIPPDSFLMAMTTLMEEEEQFRTTLLAMPAQILVNQLQDLMQPRLFNLIHHMENIKKLISPTIDYKINFDHKLQKQTIDPNGTNIAINIDTNIETKPLITTIETKVRSPKAGMTTSYKKINYGFKSPASKIPKPTVPIAVRTKAVSKTEGKKAVELKQNIQLKKADENVNHLNKVVEKQQDRKGLTVDFELTMSTGASTKDADSQMMKEIQEIKMREMEMDEQLLSSFT